jgi:hypothetical protein
MMDDPIAVGVMAIKKSPMRNSIRRLFVMKKTMTGNMIRQNSKPRNISIFKKFEGLKSIS